MSRSSTKRGLSLLDKRTLKRTDGYAFNLLGPECPEVVELLNAGYAIEQIVGVDLTEDNVKYARVVYPGIKGYRGLAKVFLDWAQPSTYSYIHLDYCGYIDESRVDDIRIASKLLLPRGRLRVTFMVENNDKRFCPSEYSKQFRYSHNIVEHIQDFLRPYFERPIMYPYRSDQDNSRMLTFWLDRRDNGRQGLQLGTNQRASGYSEEVLGN